jgi:protein-S-isoprenylcysteine O-methyltransferase Ste14
MNPGFLFISAWVTWGLSWLIAAAWSSRAQASVSATRGDVLLYRALVLIGFALLNPTASRALAARPLWNLGLAGAYALVGATILGLSFTWWARLWLGRLWSSSVTRKEGHRVVDRGPYALVRHPIYTGLIGATLATAAAIATWPAMLAVILVGVGFWLKASIEERFLAAELGQDAYDSYRRRVPMLIPFWPPGRPRNDPLV